MPSFLLKHDSYMHTMLQDMVGTKRALSRTTASIPGSKHLITSQVQEPLTSKSEVLLLLYGKDRKNHQVQLFLFVNEQYIPPAEFHSWLLPVEFSFYTSPQVFLTPQTDSLPGDRNRHLILLSAHFLLYLRPFVLRLLICIVLLFFQTRFYLGVIHNKSLRRMYPVYTRTFQDPWVCVR